MLVMPVLVLYTVIPGEVAAAPEPSKPHVLVSVRLTCGKRKPACVLCISNILPAAGSDVAGVPVPSLIFCCALALSVAAVSKHRRRFFFIIFFYGCLK